MSHPHISDHPTTVVRLADQDIEVDEAIAPMVEALNLAGVVTTQSCQDSSGRVWLPLFDTESVVRLFEVVGRLDADGEPDVSDDLTMRLRHWEVCAAYWEDHPMHWRYALGPTYLPDWGWDAEVTVEFPISDIAEVTKRAEEYSAAAAEVARLRQMCVDNGIDPDAPT